MTISIPGLGPLGESLGAAIDAQADRMVMLRRRLHAQPEASGQEQATTRLLVERLREAGLEPRVMADDTGIIVDIDLGAGTTFIAARCELDCVGVNDDKQVPYASTRPGLCHACGHDAHSTIALTTACTLAAHRDALIALKPQHNLRFIFQPSEETATGARSMIQQGAIDQVEAIIALHIDPTLETGRVGIRRGAMTAALKSFRIEIRGDGGHSARPHEAHDPIPAAVNVVSQLYQLAPRSIDSRHPLALTVGVMNAGSVLNAIPDSAELLGTLRATRDEDLEHVQHRMQAIVRGVGESTGCDIELKFSHSCPATRNDDALVNAIVAAATDELGTAGVEWLELPSLGGEDFAFYQEIVPGAFMRLGAALPDARGRRPLHSSLFDFDEAALPIGARVLSSSLLRLMMPPGNATG